MKKIYLLLTLLLSANSFSQSEIEGVWYLNYINKDGVIENHNAEGFGTPTIIFDTENFVFNGGVCNIYDGTYSVLPNEIIEINSFGQSLGGCSGTPISIGFENSYFYNVLQETNTPPNSELNYQVSGEGNNEILVLTNVFNNNFAVYGRQPLSISDSVLNELSVSITENPVKEKLQLDFKDLFLGDLNYSIFSINGKIMINTTRFNDENIKVSQLSSGIYFLKITSTDNRTKTLKFIKN